MSGYEIDVQESACPGCGAKMVPNAVLCTRCGFNLKTRERVRTDAAPAGGGPPPGGDKPAALQRARRSGGVEAAAGAAGRAGGSGDSGGPACPKCGYNLRGLGGKPCPECGHVRGAKADREAERRKQIAGYWRTTWLVAGVGLVVGTALTLGLGLGVYGMSMVRAVVHLASCEVALALGYLVVGLFIGFEEDIRGLALRLVGVAAVWSGLWLVIALMPVSGGFVFAMTGAVTFVTLVIPMHVLTGRDWDDCFWLAFGAWVVKTAIWVTLDYALPPGW